MISTEDEPGFKAKQRTQMNRIQFLVFYLQRALAAGVEGQPGRKVNGSWIMNKIVSKFNMRRSNRTTRKVKEEKAAGASGSVGLGTVAIEPAALLNLIGGGGMSGSLAAQLAAVAQANKAAQAAGSRLKRRSGGDDEGVALSGLDASAFKRHRSSIAISDDEEEEEDAEMAAASLAASRAKNDADVQMAERWAIAEAQGEEEEEEEEDRRASTAGRSRQRRGRQRGRGGRGGSASDRSGSGSRGRSSRSGSASDRSGSGSRAGSRRGSRQMSTSPAPGSRSGSKARGAEADIDLTATGAAAAGAGAGAGGRKSKVTAAPYLDPKKFSVVDIDQGPYKGYLQRGSVNAIRGKSAAGEGDFKHDPLGRLCKIKDTMPNVVSTANMDLRQRDKNEAQLTGKSETAHTRAHAGRDRYALIMHE